MTYERFREIRRSRRLRFAAICAVLAFGAVCFSSTIIQHQRNVLETITSECAGVPDESYAACRQRVLDRNGWVDPSPPSTQIVVLPQ